MGIVGLGGVKRNRELSFGSFYDKIETYYEKKGKKSNLPKKLRNRQTAIDGLWDSYRNNKKWTGSQMLKYGGGLISYLNKF
tara:strand:- start:504 stop:746 length:243 start_codon:yes stop_codon:yes gene_type:complete